ncbi:thiamine biosynthesis protein ApbE [bacterium F11]|nr:thiamine biosynthesis protein ApbE [bacterium F11]
MKTITRGTSLSKGDSYLIGRFQAMGCPCEVLMDTQDEDLAGVLIDLASREAWRIEEKISRYRKDNIIHKINKSGGAPVPVDRETSQLLDFADHCYRMSEGLFDVTSGVLRRIWKFDGKEHIPPKEDLQNLMPLVGWNKVIWESPRLQIPKGMEIDLGGIGKEYAVDKTRQLLRSRANIGLLVNFGGDIAVGGKRDSNQPWTIGVEDVNKSRQATKIIQVKNGALATSGDTKKFLFMNGRRYGHILDPRTGWPVLDPPRSVTVAANTCTEAGLLSTLAILHGQKAEVFLEGSGVRYWCSR